MRNNIHITVLGLLLLVSVNLVAGQTTLAFDETPGDAAFTEGSSFVLTWIVTGDDLSYEIHMFYPGNETNILIGSGEVVGDEISVTLDSVASGEYVFTCEVSDATSTISDEAIITVLSNSNEESDSGNSDNGFLPGFGIYQFILAVSILGIIKKSRKQLLN